MAVIDRVSWAGGPDTLAWRYPSDELSTWTQLIVNESQEAFVVRGGVYDGPFGAGRHTLTTANLPLLTKTIGLPFGGKSPFSAEVWFVNRATNLDVRWGTPDPIQLQDPFYGVMVSVRAFGQYGVRIVDSKRFLLKLVGTLQKFDVTTLSEYLRGAFITRIKTGIASAIISQRHSVLEIATQLDSLSETLKGSLAAEMLEYGIGLSQFNIHSINVPDDDPAMQSLKTALSKKAEMGIVGFNYQQERSFDVMETAAGNEGSASTMMGTGLGLGVGVAMGPQLGQAFGQAAGQIQTATATDAPRGQAVPAMTPTERIAYLKELGELKSQGILSDEEFVAEKKRVLQG